MRLPCSASVKNVVFDYGNTLIEFGARQIAHANQVLGNYLTRAIGPFDESQFTACHDRARMAPYGNGYREGNFRDISLSLVRELYHRDPTPEELADLLALRLEAFVDSIQVEPEVLEFLARLSSRFKVGLLSNYPSGEAIRRSLGRTGISEHLAGVVVSGDLGYVKPHPVTFESILRELGAVPGETIHVGDNWLADIQGAKRCGIAAVHMRRWVPFERFEPEPSDHAPDAVIADLGELDELIA